MLNANLLRVKPYNSTFYIAPDLNLLAFCYRSAFYDSSSEILSRLDDQQRCEYCI
jgi:hypothetical protein